MKKYPLTVEGFIQRLKDEGFPVVQIHTALTRRYLVGNVVLWCTPQGHVSLIEKAEYDLAGVQQRTVKAFAGEYFLFYEDGVEKTLAEIRKRVTPGVVVPEPIDEPPAVICQAPWAMLRMETTNAGQTTVVEERPTVDFRKKPGDV